MLGRDGEATAAWYRDTWLQAWNSHNPEAVIATLTEDAVFTDTGWPKPFRGREEWRAPISFRDGLVHDWWGVADMADHYRQIGTQR